MNFFISFYNYFFENFNQYLNTSDSLFDIIDIDLNYFIYKTNQLSYYYQLNLDFKLSHFQYFKIVSFYYYFS